MYNHHSSFARGYLVHKNALMRERLYLIIFEDFQVFRDVFFKVKRPTKPVVTRFLRLYTYPELLSHDTIKTQLPQKQDPLQRILREEAICPHQRDGDRRVKQCPFLVELSRRQIDRDMLRREMNAAVSKRRADTFCRLPGL